MGVNETQPAQRLPADWISVKPGDENAVRIADDYMRNRSAPVDDYPKLPAGFRGEFGEISGQFLRNKRVLMYSAAVDFLQQIDNIFLQAGCMSVKSCYIYIL
jgi:hypothetical protein